MQDFFVAHFNWCILEHTFECLQSIEYIILRCQGGLCKVVVPIFECVGYLDSFGVFRGNTLASVMF